MVQISTNKSKSHRSVTEREKRDIETALVRANMKYLDNLLFLFHVFCFIFDVIRRARGSR